MVTARVPWSHVDAVSVGSPGVVVADGTMDLATNVAGLGSTPLASGLSKALRTPVTVDNDVNMAAVGELKVGVAQKCHTFALLAHQLWRFARLANVCDCQRTFGRRTPRNAGVS